jgi:hypothetical protein
MTHKTTLMGMCLLAMLSGWAGALTLHVAVDGNDAWSGRPARPNAAHNDGPLASLDGARRAVAAARYMRRLTSEGIVVSRILTRTAL